MENSERSIFAQRFREARKKKGLSVEKVAWALDIEPSSVNWWEMGRNNPRINRLPAIARLLDVSLDWLLGMDVEGNA